MHVAFVCTSRSTRGKSPTHALDGLGGARWMDEIRRRGCARDERERTRMDPWTLVHGGWKILPSIGRDDGAGVRARGFARRARAAARSASERFGGLATLSGFPRLYGYTVRQM
jgi:hypothetical protein